MQGMEIVSIKTSRGDFYEISDPYGLDLVKDKVLEIIEHSPGGPGDSLYYEILYETEIDACFKKRVRRVFDPVEVVKEEENQ
jgi:hypothetical protein